MKKISILGCTGSIGTQALEIVREQKDIEVVALAAASNVTLIEKQIREFSPRLVCMYREDAAKDLRERVKDLEVRIVTGMEGLIETACTEDAEGVLTAIVGMIGIRPTIAAIEKKKDIYLANKETLVTAGHIIMPLAKQHGVRILPVDSEHSAIFQSLQGGGKPEKILLTCSGGPFRGKKSDDLKNMKAEDALKHPNWSMGRKITIDSATLVNKGLEVIEARWLFGMTTDRIQVVVHPQSIIHSAVQFEDGAVIAQLGLPDMKLPIQYAFYYPERRAMNSVRMDLFKIGSMTFEKPDSETFRGLKLAIEADRTGGTMPTVYNAANERAVALFLDGKIGFLDIADTIERAMAAHRAIANPTVEQILEAERETYELISAR